MIAEPVCELLVGIQRDEQFGPSIVIGSGGVFVELFHDSVSLLLPTNRREVKRAVGSLRVAKLLAGYRGRAAGELDAVVDAVMATAEFAEQNWDLVAELDINPLMVTPGGCIAADVLIRETVDSHI